VESAMDYGMNDIKSTNVVRGRRLDIPTIQHRALRLGIALTEVIDCDKQPGSVTGHRSLKQSVWNGHWPNKRRSL